MKHLSAITLIILLLLVGCRQERAVSPRLVELDSLIAVAPDSAAALLAAIPADSFHDPENRAYHALLTTQAKYKAYIPATSDSAINFAVDYYVTDDKGSYDHRIRSLIYKGCVMTELNQPDSAMYWFKRAESTARPDDHANLGYINHNIGVLFMDELEMDTTTVNYLNTALQHFTFTNDTIFQLSCLIRLGSIECLNKKSDKKLKEAQQLAIEFGENDYVIQTLEHMSLQALQGNQYQQAKKLSMNAILQGDSSVACYSYVVMSYCGLGYADSALLYLRLMPNPKNMVESMTYHRAHAEKARLLNNMEDYVLHDDSAGYYSDIIYLQKQQTALKEIEEKYENQIMSEKLKNVNYRLWLSLSLLALAIAAALLLVINFRHAARGKHLAEERLIESVRQLSFIKEENERYREEAMWLDLRSKKFAETKFRLVNTIYLTIIDKLKRNKSNASLNPQMDDNFWNDLQAYIVECHPGLSPNDYSLTSKEKKYLSLHCLGVPIEVCATLLDVSTKTTYNYRGIIAQKISDGNISNLDEAIEALKNTK